MLKLYNTLSKQLEEIPQKDHLNVYTCGPTVYDYAHIGNLRSFIMADLLYRTLKYDGYKPRWVMNITDIDDKTIKGAIGKFGPSATVENLREFTQFYLDEFLKDLREVNVLVDEIEFIRVTDKIKDIQQFIIDLVKKGYGYVADDGIYFSIEKYQNDFGDYGQLVGEKFLEGKKAGARVAVDEYEKENLSDFVLWKAHSPADANIFWEDLVNDSEVKIPRGRPGWHIECSAINHVAFKGEPTDIHTGGVDLLFPHHTNEIAQSQALLGKGNFVHYWQHSEHLLVDGKKMSKSLGNFYTLADIETKTPLANWALRHLFLQSHYRTQQNFTDEALASANNGVVGLINGVRDNPVQSSDLELSSLENDLNSPKAISENSQAVVLEKLVGVPFNQVSEDNLPEDVKNFANKRLEARHEKNFAKSDELRKQIEDLGYEVMDTPEGQKIRKKIQI